MSDINIPQLVKELRKRLGLTQEQFAQKVGVTFGSVNRWESGKRTPHPFLIRRLLEIKEELDADTLPGPRMPHAGKAPPKRRPAG